MEIRYTSRAERDVAARDAWWRENRPAAPDLFWDELNASLGILLTAPEASPLYAPRRSDGIRRILLPGSAFHVYYRVERAQQRVMVLAVWGAKRGRDPRL